jgi:citrate lyase subunit beta/citryl-CoA lyase
MARSRCRLGTRSGPTVAERSLLYVPGHRPDRFDKAWATGADGVIFDLEDAVPMSAKAEALDAVIAHLRGGGSPTSAWVRINPGAPGRREASALLDAGVACGFVVPKATRQDLDALHGLAPTTALIPLVESAPAVLEVAELAGASGVTTLAMGEVDLAADLALGSGTGADLVLWSIRTQVVVATSAAGRRGPVGPVSVEFDDLDAFAESTRILKSAGFSARQAIHPRQVAVVNEVFTPTGDEVAAARRLLELAAAADGGVCVDDQGRMVDEAVLRSARRILDQIR